MLPYNKLVEVVKSWEELVHLEKIGCNLYLKMLTSLLVVECGYGYFGWCFWLNCRYLCVCCPSAGRQLRAPRNTHSCIIGYNICQSLCSSIKLHLLDPLLFPRYNPVNFPYSEMVFVMKEFTSITWRYLKGQLKILLSHFSPKIVG